MNSARIVLRLSCAALFAAVVCRAQDTVPADSVVAKLNVAITAQGVLKGTLDITASGAPSQPIRAEFLQNAAQRSSNLPWGRFTRNRELHTTPLVMDQEGREKPIQVQFKIAEEDFLVPVQRQLALQLDLLILATVPASQSDGNLRLGTPGRFREEIALELPPGYSLEADARSSNENTFARYQSEAKSDGGKLVITREYELRQETVAGSKRSEADAFWKMVSDDQQRAFILRRTKHVDLTNWIQTVPVDRLEGYGTLAYEQREFETSKRLFVRLTNAAPDDPVAWYSLARSLDALGEREDALKAYEKQIAVDPKRTPVYAHLGLMLQSEGYWDRAVENYQKQLETRPDNGVAILDLPETFMAMGRWEDAEKAAAKALQLHPTNTELRVNVAVARACQDRDASGREQIYSALGPSPSAALLNHAAYALAGCEKENLAETLVRQALAQLASSEASARSENMASAIGLQNRRGSYLDTYGWVLFKKGDNDRAINFLSAAATLNPRGEIFAHLAQAESKAGNSDKAAQDWREATFLQPGQLSRVPPDILPKLENLSPLSPDRVWFPLESDLPADIAAALSTDHPSYYFAAFNADGSVRSIRALDSEDQGAGKALPLLRAVNLPVIRVDATPVQAVYLLKLFRDSQGKAVASRSIAPEATYLAADFLPGEFPLPDSATPPAPASESPGGSYRIGGGVTAPSILYKKEPNYSVEARKANLEGKVKLAGVVDASGKPRALRVVQSLGLGLDEEATNTVSTWQFSPGHKEGQPVAVQVVIEVNFRLLNKDQKPVWRLTQAAFQTAGGVQRPIIERTTSPHIAKDVMASATVSFVVNERGEPADIHIDKSSDDGWANDVADALRKWRFVPGSKDGQPLSVPCTMEFVRVH